MEDILTILWHVPTVMIVLLVAGLLMGQRHVGELSIFDLLTGIAIGAVAGAGIVDPDLPYLPMLVAILALSALHLAFTWVIMHWLPLGRLATFEPVVVIRNGKPLRSTMHRIRFTLSDLLPLLREKDIFDLREVKYAVLEPDGSLTVVRAGQPPAPQWTAAVIVDGTVEEQVLESLGWNREQLWAELQKQGKPFPEDIFLATLSESGDLYVVPRGDEPGGPVIRH